MSKIVLVGAGNMGFAMLRTWAQAPKYQLIAIEPNDALRARAGNLGVETYAAPDGIPDGTLIDVLVVATKPQNVGDVVGRYAALLSPNALIISIAAGVGLGTMSGHVGPSIAIIRAMPNTPASIGEGMIVCCPNEPARRSNFRRTAEDLLSVVGRVSFVDDEGLMDAVTAVSGSGPAYIFHFIEALAEAGTKAGLTEDFALLLAKQTVYGAAKLATQSDETPAHLREQVTSPNGTTAAALSVLMRPENGLQDLLEDAVDAAKRRSEELGK